MSITRADCIEALKNSGVAPLEAEETVDVMLERKKRLAAAGKLERGIADLAEATMAEHKQAQIDAAMRRRQTAITIMRRVEIESDIGSIKQEGGSFIDAIKTMMVGHGKRFTGARKSIDARRASIEAEFSGRLVNGFEAIGEKSSGDRNMVFKLLAGDTAFQADFARERYTPGSTQDSMAAAAADVYARLSEEMRIRYNAAGANIGRLEGRLPQSHDVYKMLDKKNGGQTAWVDFVMERLDHERSFPGRSSDEVRETLSRIYGTIVSGRDLNLTGTERSTGIGPKNIASGMGKHRVLHFKDADAFTAYHSKYGRGTIANAINDEITQAARNLSLMERMGPNPEHMLRSLVENEKDSIRIAMEKGELDPVQGNKLTDKINSSYNTNKNDPAGKIANWMKVLTGEVFSPVNIGFARYGSIMRAWMSMAKLGGATLSAMADPFTKAASLRVNGVGFLERYQSALFDYMKQYSGREREIARELGFLVRSTLGSMLHRFDPADTAPGRVSKAMNMFFKYSGLDFVTESAKVGYAMAISRHVASFRSVPFEKLIPEMKAMLEYHGVDAKTWGLWQHMTEGVNDKRFFNPSLARNLSDRHLEAFLPEHLMGDKPAKGYTPEQWHMARERELARIRQNVETDARAFFADDTKFAVIEPDAATTATMTQGLRTGTPGGESIRAMLQFKSFPIAYWQRQIGGKRWQRGGHQGIDYPGIIEFAVSAMAFGYIAMTLKDIANNRTPKDPSKVATWFAAAAQSGGAGIYGDFFLGQVNRFGSDFAETAVGPFGGVLSDLVKTGQSALHGEPGQARDQLYVWDSTMLRS